MLAAAHVIGSIAWDPTIRGFLVVLVGVVVLMGSVYLVLATDTGARLGLLIALGALFGWMTIMGSVWWMYGIGLKGADPTWQVVEVNYGDLSQANLTEAHDLRTWAKLPTDDPQVGEAKAAVDEYIGPTGRGIFQATSDYIAEDAFDIGGKTYFPGLPFLHLFHKPHYALVQVQQVLVQTPLPGAAPPIPKADTTKPVISVIMERNLGDRRFPAGVITLSSLTIFLLVMSTLHRRDKQAMAARAAAAAATTDNKPVPAGMT